MKHIIGLDIGYGYTKAYNTKLAHFPSIVGYPEKIRYQERLLSNGSAPTSTDYHSGIEIETPNGVRFVGELALLQSRVKWTPQDRNRTGTDTMLTLALAALSELAAKGDLYLVTGLPVVWFDDRQKIIDLLLGEHTIRRCGHKPVNINILDALVLPQPFGSFFSKILNEKAQLINKELAAGRVAIIDVGMHTTDFVMVDELRYIENASYGLETAMSRVYELVSRALEDQYQIQLDLHQTSEAIRRGKINAYGTPVPIADIIDPILSAVAEEIGAMAARLWGDGSRVDRILVTGGGASPIGPYLTERFPHNLELLGGGGTANVRGYYNYGVRKWAK